MTLEELRAQHADLVAQIEREAVDAAITQERARLQAIESISASVGDRQMVHDAMYGENPCTAEQLAFQAMQKQAALGAQHIANTQADANASGVNNVGAAPNGGSVTEQNDGEKVAEIVNLFNATRK